MSSRLLIYKTKQRNRDFKLDFSSLSNQDFIQLCEQNIEKAICKLHVNAKKNETVKNVKFMQTKFLEIDDLWWTIYHPIK